MPKPQLVKYKRVLPACLLHPGDTVRALAAGRTWNILPQQTAQERRSALAAYIGSETLTELGLLTERCEYLQVDGGGLTPGCYIAVEADCAGVDFAPADIQNQPQYTQDLAALLILDTWLLHHGPRHVRFRDDRIVALRNDLLLSPNVTEGNLMTDRRSVAIPAAHYDHTHLPDALPLLNRLPDDWFRRLYQDTPDQWREDFSELLEYLAIIAQRRRQLPALLQSIRPSSHDSGVPSVRQHPGDAPTTRRLPTVATAYLLAPSKHLLALLISVLCLSVSAWAFFHWSRGSATVPAYHDGLNALDDRRSEHAIAIFERIHTPEAQLSLALALMQAYEQTADESALARAEQTLTALAETPGIARERYASARALLAFYRRNGRLCLELVRPFLHLNVDEIHRTAARCYNALREPAASRSEALKAMSIDRNSRANRMALAGAFMLNNEPGIAELLYSGLNADYPGRYEILSNLGAAQVRLGLYSQAQESFDASLRVRSSPQAYTNVGTLLLSQGLCSMAIPMYRAAVEQAPTVAALLYLAEAYHCANDPSASATYSKALAQLSRAGSLEAPEARSQLALMYARLGDFTAADTQLREGAPTDATAAYAYALVSFNRNRTEESIRWLRAASGRGVSGCLIRQDPTFQTLRARSDFRQIPCGH